MIEARIDQREEIVHILSVSASASYGRDVTKEQIPVLVNGLKQWEGKLARAQTLFEDMVQKELNQSVKEGYEHEGLVKMQVDENMKTSMSNQHKEAKKAGKR